MSNIKQYPLHQSLYNSLRTTDAPLLTLRLIRHLQEEMMIYPDETEILLGLAGKNTAFSFDDVCFLVRHLSKDTVKRCLLSLNNLRLISMMSTDCDHGFNYHITETASQRIMCIDKDSLN